MENHSEQTYHTTMVQHKTFNRGMWLAIQLFSFSFEFRFPHTQQQTDASSLPCYDCLNTSEDGDGDEDEDEDNQEEKKNEEDEQA